MPNPTPTTIKIVAIEPGAAPYALVIHGGAGGQIEELSADERSQYSAGLEAAFLAGEAILERGGSAVDAVCASVESLEDNPLFNAGHGAALTALGEAELDASVMMGDGRAGAIAVSRYAKNPIRAARKVLEETDHVLLVGPSKALVESWQLETVEPAYFVTEPRVAQLKNVQASARAASRHGTVGAVALDSSGQIAAGTSTGGMVDQSEGRVGDTPVIGAGTFAHNGVAAISCTGEGESFIEGVVAHDIYARMKYVQSSLAEAMTSTIRDELQTRNSNGGIIAVDAEGRVVVGYNSEAMFAAYRENGEVITLA